MTRLSCVPTVVPVVRGAGREGGTMQALVRSFEQPEETTTFPNGDERVVHVLGKPIGMATFRPGWRWSNDVRPLMGTDGCPLLHAGYMVAGHLHVEVSDGTTIDIGPGDAFAIPPGHDAWVEGDESVVMLDWGGNVREYARPVEEAKMANRQAEKGER